MTAKRGCFIVVVVVVSLIVISGIIAFFKKELVVAERVALVRVVGPILQAEDIVREIRRHTKDTSILAIALRIDSPGGGVAATQEIYEEVKRAAVVKPVIVSMGGVAASGGLYIALPASKIIANPGTITGSIGVMMKAPNIERFMDKLGIEMDIVKSGVHKDMASVFREMGEEEREILQGVIEDVHEQFIEAVSKGREMPIEEARLLADGRVFSGRQAMEVGLVDALGCLRHAIMVAAEAAGIVGEPKVVTIKREPTILDLLGINFLEKMSRIFPRAELKFLYMPEAVR
ncbi:signal peptide peptidase SppA [Thermodesulfovibrionales bacterium]|nr:signal peptide peptidase SppA [Thermodesulfovibrionales bacterium]MCL0085316.1 signal peptide peptidase SppA [Thermodesulfovibrionales bacterium]